MNTITLEKSSIGEKIQELLRKRFQVVYKVGIYKKIHHIATLDETRWKQVLERITTLGALKGIPKDFIHSIWNDIHHKALELEDSISIGNQKEAHSLEVLRKEINQIDADIIDAFGILFENYGVYQSKKIISEIIERVCNSL